MISFSIILFTAFCLICPVVAEKQTWESTKLTKAIVVRSTEHRLLYEGIVESSECFSMADTLSGKTVQFHNATQVCSIYKHEISDDHLGDSNEYFIYRKPKDFVSSHKITATGIVFTILWCSFVCVALIGLAIFFRHTSVPVHEQLSRIEKREAQIEEAVSEEWERRSAMEEMVDKKKIDQDL